jgi:hypothetical protein
MAGPRPGGDGPLLEVLRGLRLALLHKHEWRDRVYWSLANALQQASGPEGPPAGTLPALALQLITETPRVFEGSDKVPQSYECVHEVGVVLLVDRGPHLAAGASSGTDVVESETEKAARLAQWIKRLVHANPTLPTPAAPHGPAAGVRYVRSDYDAEGEATAVMLVVRLVFEIRYKLDVTEAALELAIAAEGVDVDWRAPAPQPAPTAQDVVDLEQP